MSDEFQPTFAWVQSPVCAYRLEYRLDGGDGRTVGVILTSKRSSSYCVFDDSGDDLAGGVCRTIEVAKMIVEKTIENWFSTGSCKTF